MHSRQNILCFSSVNSVVNSKIKKIDEIFERNVSTTRGGAGLGLYDARKIINKLKGKINAEKHIEFLEKIIKQHPNRKIIVVEDGAPAHRAKKVSEFAEQQKKRFAIYRLPPYAPDLNPDEHVWE